MIHFFQRVSTLEIKPVECDLDGNVLYPVDCRKDAALTEHSNKKKFSPVKQIIRLFSPKKKVVRSNSITSMNTMANRNQPLELCLMFATTPRTSSVDSESGSGRNVTWSDSVEVIHIWASQPRTDSFDCIFVYLTFVNIAYQTALVPGTCLALALSSNMQRGRFQTSCIGSAVDFFLWQIVD